MTQSERTKLLFGPYQCPRLKRGDRAFCEYRDATVVILDMTNARIPWPRCRRLDPPSQGRGPLVNEELARAVRTESATAIAYWWGVHTSTVLSWRRALGVTRKNNQGTHRLILGAITATLESRFGAGPRRVRIRAGGTQRCRAAVWTADEIALLGTAPDSEVAAKMGRSVASVGPKRRTLGTSGLDSGHARRGDEGLERA